MRPPADARFPPCGRPLPRMGPPADASFPPCDRHEKLSGMPARLAAALALALTLALAAPAGAAVRYGSGGPDRIRGTATADALYGLGGKDTPLTAGGDARAV